jgi:hypothetical protein
MLVSFPGDPPPVGSKLKIRMDHPSRHDEQVEIAGVVARHVETSGETCLGIQFRVPEAQEQSVAEFIRQLRAVEHSRRLGGINGPIADLGIRSVLTMFGSSAPEGMLTLTRGSDEGYITISNGSLRAQVGGLCGREALEALLSWKSGRFDFEAQADESLVNGESIPVAEILGDAAALDESAPRIEDAADAGDQGLDDGIAEDQELELIDLDEDEPTEEREAAPAAPEDEEEDFSLDVDMIDFEEEDEDYEDDDEVRDEPEAREQEEPEEDAGIGDFVFEEESDDFDEGASVESVPIAPESVLVLAAEGDRSDLGKTEAALLDLAAVGMTVAKVVEIIPESEGEIYEALRNLVDQGLLALE